MRIKLIDGKQKELLLNVKNILNISWKELAKNLKINSNYLINEIKNEKVTLDSQMYLLLCKMAGKNYDKFIHIKLENSWGQSKGGLNSIGNTKEVKYPNKDENLAELCGIILGDGNLNEYKKGKKIRVYSLRIAGHMDKDKEYLTLFVKKLIENSFNIKTRLYFSKRCNGLYLIADGKNLIEFFKSIGIKSGNKIKNNQNIPDWIMKDKIFLKYFLRGLFDTDGSIYRMSRKNPNLLRISIKSYIPNLYKNILDALISLNFNPHEDKICNQISISKKKEVARFISEIGFNNKKHLNRIINFKTNSPMM